MNDFIFHDFDKACHRYPSLQDDEVSITRTEKSMYIFLNRKISSDIQEMGFRKLRIMENAITGELYLLFNKKNGCSINPSVVKKPSIMIANTGLVQFIVNKLGLTQIGRDILKISKNKANSNDYLTYQILETI